MGEFQHLGSTRFAGAEASLLWYKDMFGNGRQAVQCQALVQFEEVTQQGNWSEAFREPPVGPFLVSEGQQHVPASRVSVSGVFLRTR